MPRRLSIGEAALSRGWARRGTRVRVRRAAPDRPAGFGRTYAVSPEGAEANTLLNPEVAPDTQATRQLPVHAWLPRSRERRVSPVMRATLPVVRVRAAVDRFVAWLVRYGETSSDYQSFFASRLGRAAKALYYRR